MTPTEPVHASRAAAIHALVGETAVGKSEVALRVAERAGAEILSLDSMLVYRGMDVGTAKPTPAERARVPHHLIDLVDPTERFSVQHYLAAAGRALDDVRARGRRALFVGGTALYLKALTHGLFEGPPVDRELRARVESRVATEGPAAAHASLEAVDARSAARIHPNDTKRLVRALEVWEQTGRSLSDWQGEWETGAGAPARGRERTIVGLSLPVEELDRRIARRTAAMLDAGWADEVRALRERGPLSDTAVQALGYAEVAALVDGEIDRAACEERIALRTRQFARRQRTWFRKFPEIVRVEVQGKDPAEVVDGVLRSLGWSSEPA